MNGVRRDSRGLSGTSDRSYATKFAESLTLRRLGIGFDLPAPQLPDEPWVRDRGQVPQGGRSDLEMVHSRICAGAASGHRLSAQTREAHRTLPLVSWVHFWVHLRRRSGGTAWYDGARNGTSITIKVRDLALNGMNSQNSRKPPRSVC